MQADATVKARRHRSAIAGRSGADLWSGLRRQSQLYNLLRSLDTLGTVVTPGTKIILRTDAAPFRALVDGPKDVQP